LKLSKGRAGTEEQGAVLKINQLQGILLVLKEKMPDPFATPDLVV